MSDLLRQAQQNTESLNVGAGAPRASANYDHKLGGYQTTSPHAQREMRNITQTPRRIEDQKTITELNEARGELLKLRRTNEEMSGHLMKISAHTANPMIRMTPGGITHTETPTISERIAMSKTGKLRPGRWNAAIGWIRAVLDLPRASTITRSITTLDQYIDARIGAVWSEMNDLLKMIQGQRADHEAVTAAMNSAIARHREQIENLPSTFGQIVGDMMQPLATELTNAQQLADAAHRQLSVTGMEMLAIENHLGLTRKYPKADEALGRAVNRKLPYDLAKRSKPQRRAASHSKAKRARAR